MSDVLQQAIDPSLTTAELWGLLGLDGDRFESTEPNFLVFLQSCGARELSVIQEIRAMTKLGLKETKDLVEEAPREIGPLLSFQDAIYWSERLVAEGATAYIKDLRWSHDTALGVAIARHQSLSKELTLYLLASGERELQGEIAANPHLPKEVLSTAALLQPKCFLQNPILPLLLLEDPNLPQLSGAALARLIEQEGAPAPLLSAALNSEEASVGLARMDLQKLPRDLLERLARLSFWSTQNTLANNQQTPSWVLEILAKIADDFVLADVTSHPNVTPQVLEALSQNEDTDVVASVGRSELCPVSLLQRLSLHEHREVYNAVASNPRTPIETLHALHQRLGGDVFYSLSENPNLPLVIAQEIIDIKNENLRQILARNRSPEILRALFTAEPRLNIKLEILRNKRCPQDVLDLARQDEREEVRALATKIAAG